MGLRGPKPVPLDELLSRHSGMRDANGHIPWIGAKQESGHGVCRSQRRTIRGHRLSWLVHYGEIPNGLVVRHHPELCVARPDCVEPTHLILGTQADNVQDTVQQNRTAWGERSNLTKYTKEQIALVKRRHKEGWAYNEILNETPMSKGNLSMILRGISRRREP